MGPTWASPHFEEYRTNQKSLMVRLKIESHAGDIVLLFL